MQKEKPGPTPEMLGALFKTDPAGVICSGGQIENFREGWAIEIMSNSEKAHYFKRANDNIALADALCGFVARVRWLYGQGNHGRCKRCQRIKARQ